MEAFISRINIYPVKSFLPVTVISSGFNMSGGLINDRVFAIFDKDGNYVNGKRNPKVHGLRLSINHEQNSMIIENRNGASEYSLNDLQPVNRYLSVYFEEDVELRRNYDTGFPDDTNSPGPTIISTGTLNEVASWYSGLDADQVRLRFRANIEIDGVPAFWEDRLYGENDSTRPFKIGEAEIEGVNPCQRCVVPTRDPITGEVIPGFSNRFTEQRESKLPVWAPKTRFNHYYRLAVNTRVPQISLNKLISVGDVVYL